MSENKLEKIYYGKNTVYSILMEKEVEKIYIQKGFKDEKLKKLFKEKNVPFVLVDKIKMDKMCNNANHQGIIAKTSPVNYSTVEHMIEKNNAITNPLVLIYDELTDPNNLGAILRSVDAFDISGVIISKKRNVQLNSTVAKVAQGAIFHVDVARVSNIKNSISNLKKHGYWVAYLDMDGNETLDKVKFDKPLAIVVGGEDKGVTDIMKKHCDFGIKINMFGHVNSLNVASATSVLAYQYSVRR